MGVDVGAAEKPIVEPVPTQPALGDLGFEPLPGPRGVADDLKKLPGMSPAIEKQLNDLGIFHYSQIAELQRDGRAQYRRRSGLARPRRRLDRQGQGTDGRVSRRATAGDSACAMRTGTMANITAQMVKELRETTGAGMMDCKAALTETNGDMEAAQSTGCARRVSPRPPRRPAASRPKA